MNDESRFISLMSDYGFKVTFADESDTLFLRKALQALIQSDVPIKKVQFIRNDFVGLTEVARGGLYDLACEDERGRFSAPSSTLFRNSTLWSKGENTILMTLHRFTVSDF